MWYCKTEGFNGWVMIKLDSVQNHYNITATFSSPRGYPELAAEGAGGDWGWGLDDGFGTTAVLNGSCGVRPEGKYHTKGFSH